MNMDFMIKLKEIAEEQNSSLRAVALRECFRYYKANGYSMDILEDEFKRLTDPDLFEIYRCVYKLDENTKKDL